MLSLSKWANQDESHSSGRELLTSAANCSVLAKIALPRTGFAEALHDIVVSYVCRDRADQLWQFGMRSKHAHRPGRTAVRGCVLIEARKPGRPTCRLRTTCRSVG